MFLFEIITNLKLKIQKYQELKIFLQEMKVEEVENKEKTIYILKDYLQEILAINTLLNIQLQA